MVQIVLVFTSYYEVRCDLLALFNAYEIILFGWNGVFGYVTKYKRDLT